MKRHTHDAKKITTALLLAAGTGSRLFPLTQNEPKCLTMVNGTSILERLISNLRKHGFKRLVVVTGYLENRIREELGTSRGKLKIEYVHSPKYKTTNNIYSLWMARKYLSEPFVLFESDLVFDESLLEGMLYPDRIALDNFGSWMNGTSVTLTDTGSVNAFISGNAESPSEETYKTVNIYSLSRASWNAVSQRLDTVISAGKVNDYYETVFSDLVDEGSLSFQKVSFKNKPWYEIDTIEDLRVAEKLFPSIRPVLVDKPVNLLPQPRLPDVGFTGEAIRSLKYGA
ncbi:MAG: phosphocholine cytidylyltransferase family protein [Spirochaetaceae bacterium]|nr:phosphocholine cytidylyltransferase family protein [Spirochaetaceae bacterium]